MATGVNKSGFYSEFKDKEDLFISMEHNLGSSRPSIVCKIDDLMNIIRTL
jgi:hypothetical protein